MSKTGDDEQAFIQTVRADLDRGAAQLDADTLRALSNARRHALSHRTRPRVYWKTAGGLALAGLTALAVVRIYQPASTPSQPSNALEDVELLSSAQDLDLYQDLEFYSWLATDEHAGS